MADEKEKKGGFFKIFKQFVTGEESAEEPVKKEKVEVPQNEDELEKLLKTKARVSTPPPVIETSFIETEPAANAGELQMAEVARLLQFVAKMDKPGPQAAYFEFLTARDGAGAIEPGMEKIVLKTIISSLSAVPDLKGLNAEAIALDAERQLRLLQEFASKRQLELETATKADSQSRQKEIRTYNSEIAARRKAIESLQAEITEFEKKVNAVEESEVMAATAAVHQLNAARRAADQVSTKITKDISEIRKFLMPPPTQS